MADADENNGCNDDDDDGDHGGDGNNEEVINWPGVARQCSWAPLGQQMMVMMMMMVALKSDPTVASHLSGVTYEVCRLTGPFVFMYGSTSPVLARLRSWARLGLAGGSNANSTGLVGLNRTQVIADKWEATAGSDFPES